MKALNAILDLLLSVIALLLAIAGICLAVPPGLLLFAASFMQGMTASHENSRLHR